MMSLSSTLSAFIAKEVCFSFDFFDGVRWMVSVSVVKFVHRAIACLEFQYRQYARIFATDFV